MRSCANVSNDVMIKNVVKSSHIFIFKRKNFCKMSKGVRLEPSQVLAICQTFRTNFLENDHLWLFGSRANLSKRGGDIDLYIETTIQPLRKALDAKNKFYIQLIKQLGDQKIDIVINDQQGSNKLIYDIAKTEGIQLI